MAFFGLFKKRKEDKDVAESPGGSEQLVEGNGLEEIKDAVSTEIDQEEKDSESEIIIEEEEEEKTEELENADAVNVTGSVQGAIREAVFEEISSVENCDEVELEEENQGLNMDTMQDEIQEAVAFEVEKTEGKEKKGFFKRLFSGLEKTRNSITSGIDSIFSSFSKIDDDFFEEIEEVLVMADIGIHTTNAIIEELNLSFAT